MILKHISTWMILLTSMVLLTACSTTSTVSKDKSQILPPVFELPEKPLWLSSQTSGGFLVKIDELFSKKQQELIKSHQNSNNVKPH